MATAMTIRLEELLCDVRLLITDLSLVTVSAADVVASRRLVDAAELLCTQMVARHAADGSYIDDGFRDMSAFLAMRAHTLQSEGNARVKRAALLESLPAFGSAAVAGAITSTHIQLLANVVTGPRTDLARLHEPELVAAALSLDASAFKIVLQRWASYCDDVLGDPSSDDEHQAKRGVQLRQLMNGMWSINGLLDPEAGTVIEAAIEAATPKPSVDDTRSLSQHRHDALADICRESLSCDDRSVTTGQRPQVSLIMNAADGTAHTANNWYVSTIERDLALCDCVVTAVSSCKGVVFDVGNPETLIPLRNRRAVVARDRCCRFPGCDRPSRWSDIHHVKERENGGCHQIENLVLLCRFHHRHVHKQHIKLRWGEDRITLTATMTNGTMLHGPPHPMTHTATLFN